MLICSSKKEWKLSFDLWLTSEPRNTSSIVHLTTSSGREGRGPKHGSRTPALFLHRSGALLVQTTIDDNSKWGGRIEEAILTPKKWDKRLLSTQQGRWPSALWVLVVNLLKSQHYWEFQYQNMVQCHANVWSLQTSSRWTKIEVEQSKQFEDIVFVIRFDGKEVARTVNHDPRSLSKVSIYMDDCPCFLTKLKEHSRAIC